MANAYRFQEIVAEAKALFDITHTDDARDPMMRDSREATEYLRTQIKRLNKVDGSDLLSGDEFLKTRRILPGRMYMWKYANPIYRADSKKLQYYDIFPCAFILEHHGSWFSAINLHYIPPLERAHLMDTMWQFIMKPANNNWLTRLRPNIYGMMKRRYAMKWYHPCVKRYNMKRIPGRLMLITPDHWDIMMQLPVATFRKSSINRVYRESRIDVRKQLMNRSKRGVKTLGEKTRSEF